MPGTKSRLRADGAQAGPAPSGMRGYTVVELVLVIVILGILGAIAAPRFFDNDAFAERAYFDEVATALRYGQKVAVASGCRVRVTLTANAYTVAQQVSGGGTCDPLDTTFPLPALLADGSPLAGSAPSGITLSPPLSIVYVPDGSTNLASNQTIAVGPWTLVIDAASGLVAVP